MLLHVGWTRMLSKPTLYILHLEKRGDIFNHEMCVLAFVGSLVNNNLCVDKMSELLLDPGWWQESIMCATMFVWRIWSQKLGRPRSSKSSLNLHDVFACSNGPTKRWKDFYSHWSQWRLRDILINIPKHKRHSLVLLIPFWALFCHI